MLSELLDPADEGTDRDVSQPDSTRDRVAQRAQDGTLALAAGGLALLQGLRSVREDRARGGTNLLLGGALVSLGVSQRRQTRDRAPPETEELEEEALSRDDDRTSFDEGGSRVDEARAASRDHETDRTSVDDDLAEEVTGAADDAAAADEESDESEDQVREATNDVIDQIDDDVIPASGTDSFAEESNAGQGRTGNTRPIAESDETPAPSDDGVPVDEDIAEPTESPVGTSTDEDPSREDEGMEAIGQGMTGEDDQATMADDGIGEAEGEEVLGEAQDESALGEIEADRVTDEAEVGQDDPRVNREGDLQGGGETEEMADPDQVEDLVESLEDPETDLGDVDVEGAERKADDEGADDES